jgi:hypothetical protein
MFNFNVGYSLLHKFEGLQYVQILTDHSDPRMAQLCGTPQLLRLFKQTGVMLAFKLLDVKSLVSY